MVLKLTFADEWTKWHALRNFLWNSGWNPDAGGQEPKISNIDLGLGSFYRSNVVTHFGTEIRIAVATKPGADAKLLFDGLLHWTCEPRNLVVMEAPTVFETAA